jgi:hypothetical protein
MRTNSVKVGLAVGALSLTVWMASCGSSTSSTGNPGTGAGSCNQACAAALAAHCPNDTQNTCTAKCQNPVPSCQAQFDALSACLPTATWTCVMGSAQPQGCSTQQLAFATCFLVAAFDGGFSLD